jgi:cell division septation protein DedD
VAAADFGEPAGGGFVVQVHAARRRSEALGIAKRLAGKGYQAFVTTSGSGPASMYRVRVGKFATRQEAKAVSDKLEAEERFKPWITR